MTDLEAAIRAGISIECEIGVNEWYPVFSIEKPETGIYAKYNRTIPVALAERWRRALAEFEAVQAELKKIHDKEPA